MKKNRKLKSLVNQLLFLSAMLPCVVFILVSANALRLESTNKFKAETRHALGMLDKTVSNYDTSVNTAFSIVQSDVETVEALEKVDAFGNLKHIVANISNFVGESLVSLDVYSLKNNTVMNKDGEIAVDKKMANEDWVTIALGANGALVEVKTNRTKEGGIEVQYAKTITKSTPDGNGGMISENIGVMNLTVSFRDMVESVKNMVLTTNANILVFDKDFKVIFDKEESLVGKTSLDVEWFTEVMRCKNKKFMDIEIDGEDYILYKETNRVNDVTIAALIPNKDVISGVMVSIKPIISFALFILVMIIVIGYSFGRKITKPFAKMMNDLKPFESGDFRNEILAEEGCPAEINDVVAILNDTRVNLSSIVNNVKKASSTIEENATTLAEIASQSYTIMDGVVSTVCGISEDTQGNVSRVGELSTTSTNLSEEITNAKNLSENILINSSEITNFSMNGQAVVSELKGSFEENNAITTEVIENIREVSKVSREINTITDSMKSITRETNMLSINASIEASKAGEVGRGFAVVADSIRGLANQSEESTKKIDAYIAKILQTIEALEAKVSSLSSINEVTSKDVDKTYNHFNQIITQIEGLNERISNVSKSLVEIDKDRLIVVKNIHEVSEASEEVSVATEEVTASIEEQSAQLEEITSSTVVLTKLALELQDLLDKFQTTEEDVR